MRTGERLLKEGSRPEVPGDYAPSVRRSVPAEVPESLLAGRAGSGHFGFVILGAGCAGLSVCYYLLERGVTEPILILDQRTTFDDDRTWCFWDVEDTPFSHLAIESWRSWSVTSGKRTITQTSESHPYLCLAAGDFYESVLRSIAAYPNVTLRLGEAVESREERGAHTLVRTSGDTYAACVVLDGRGLAAGSPAFTELRQRSCWVPQQFLGMRLRTTRPVFDPEVCTLMDFSVNQSRGLRFMYALPFGEREALVENVYLSEVEVSAEEHRVEISAYLHDHYGLLPHEYRVDGEERGYIPMTDYRFSRRIGERSYSIGMLGGETRPSTGYTFLRIQRYCRALAEALAGDREPPLRADPWRFEVLDAIFLRFMRRYPERCPDIYATMFNRVPPSALVRFLTERSTPLEDLRLILALPKTPFLKVAGGMLLDRHP